MAAHVMCCRVINPAACFCNMVILTLDGPAWLHSSSGREHREHACWASSGSVKERADCRQAERATGKDVEAEGSRPRLPFLQGFLAGFLSSFLASAGLPSAPSFLRRFTMGLRQASRL